MWRRYIPYRNRTFVYGAFFVTIAIMAMVFGQMDSDKLSLTWGKIKPGTKLYADSLYATDTAIHGIVIYRRIRPVNADDISKMNLPQWKKTKMIAGLDTTAAYNRPSMLDLKITFSQDSMFKQHTAALGQFVRSDSLAGDAEEKKGLYFPKKWYGVIPNQSICDTSNYSDLTDKYTFVDSYYYVDPLQVSLTELPVFLNKKSVDNSAKSRFLNTHYKKHKGKKTTQPAADW